MSDLDVILARLKEIDTKVSGLSPAVLPTPPEIIDSKILCERLFISEPTLIKWRNKKKIPFIKLDGVIRYNWVSVVSELEKPKRG